MSKQMVVTLPPEVVAMLEQVTVFRRGQAGPKMMATVARSVLEVALQRELDMIQGGPVSRGQVFYDAGDTPDEIAERLAAAAARVAEPGVPLNQPMSLDVRLRALDLAPRRDYGRGTLDLPFKRLWDSYAENFDSPEAALDNFEQELAEAAERVGHEIENPRGFFVATKREA